MRKNIFTFMAAALLCAGLTACGGNGSGSGSDAGIPTDGVLGKDAPQLYAMMTELEVDLPKAKNEVSEKVFESLEKNGGQNAKSFEELEDKIDNSLKGQYEKLKEREEELRQQIPQKIEELANTIRGNEVTTVIEDKAPLKVVEPYRIVEVRGKTSLSVECECTVELTKESPANYLDHLNSSQLMTTSCEDGNKESLTTFVKNSIRIVGGSWPDKVYPAGTQFIISTSMTAGISSGGGTLHVNDGLFRTKQITIHWAANTYKLDKGKLGSIEVGRPIPELAASVDGLYDKYEYKKEEHEDDMDGPWTEEYYMFYKDGKEAFKAFIYEGVVWNIDLLEGSSHIKTADGFFVGYSVRELFQKKRMEWTNYYDGNVFGKSGHFYYYINNDDLIQTDIPHNVDQIQPEAKVIRISYVKE